MSNISKITMREKLDVAEFYADAMAGDVIELRKNSATISSPGGVEYIKYWELREFKQCRQQKYQTCLNRISNVFKNLRNKNHVR